ncbi:MAG: TIM barrel protein [Clostridiales bacterium]|nr:TIM barrel protein [Clostridiales bacterium]
MKYLTNLSTSSKIMDWFDSDWNNVKNFLSKHKLDAVELLLKNDTDIAFLSKENIMGLHLNYWPMWLDFWNNNTEALLEEFGNLENIKLFYGGTDRQVLIEHYKREWEIAQKLDVEYVVFHVAHVRIKDTYTKKFDYTDWDVIKASIDLINQSFGNKDTGIKILFENLWWPGLKLIDPVLTKKFLDSIEYPNKGFMLDIGHMMITNPDISTEGEACKYINSIINNLGDLKKYIKGIHLNKSLSGEYIKKDYTEELETLNNLKDFWDKLEYVKPHISNMDCHIPFDYPEIKKIVKKINPDYLVFELLSSDLDELDEMLSIQREIL